MPLVKSKLSLFVILLFVATSCSVTKSISSSYPEMPQEYRNYKGILRSVTYPTSVPGPKERRMYAYLPPDYDNSDTRYHVLYLLHGARGDEFSWITQGTILTLIDSLMTNGEMKPMIVVFPNMNSYDSDEDYAMSRHKGALESFFEVDGVVETSFVNDVVRSTDSLFRTIPEKKARAIAGLSLGGMQAIYISASSPSTFGQVGVFSAPLHSAIKQSPYSSFYKDIETKLDAQLTDTTLTYEVYVGSMDIYHGAMKKFSEKVNAKGIKCGFHEVKGGHEWRVWREFVRDFLNILQ